MSGYVRGHEPPCPARTPACTGKIRDRSAQRCAGCVVFLRKAEAAARAELEPAPTSKAVETDSMTVTGDTCQLSKVVPTRVKTLADLILACEIDTDEWDIVEWNCKASQQASVPRATRAQPEDRWTRPTTEPVLTQMFHVSAKLRRKVDVLAARVEIADLIADAKRVIRALPKRPLVRHAGLTARDSMLELALPDLHVGKLAWGEETGHGNYDVKIAVQRFHDALDALIARTSGHRFAKVLLVVGNDLLNSDNAQNTTTRGTPQSTDGRYQKTYVVVRRMIVAAIEERLRPIAPEVAVVVVPGNHDTLAAFHMGDSLEMRFHGTAGVHIDNAPRKRKYQQFGRNMVMFTHGDKEKPLSLPMLMAAEQPEMWAATVHREAHTGHRHMRQATRFDRHDIAEFNGVVTRVSPALCEPEDWHAEQGYVGNARAAEAFVWHKTDGIVATAHYTVPESR